VISKFIVQTQLVDHSEDELVGFVEEVVCLLHAVASQFVPRREPTQTVTGFEKNHINVLFRQLIGCGEAGKATADNPDTRLGHSTAFLEVRCLGR